METPTGPGREGGRRTLVIVLLVLVVIVAAAAPEAMATPRTRPDARRAAPAPTLRVDSDVPGANVFLHKHGVGSCRGRLVATPAGLRYEAEKAREGLSS